MKKIKLFYLPLFLVLAIALLAVLLKVVSQRLQPYIFIPLVAIGLLPMLQEIIHSIRKKKPDLGIPVFVTLLILLYIKDYWIAGVFMLLIIVGKIFKEYILWRVERSVNEISHSLPDTAFLKDGEIREIKISDIKIGDLLVVKAGGRVPVDGTLATDEASLDESVITGESRLIAKHKGDKLIAGSINQSDYLEMTATDISEHSTLSQIHKMVEEAQSRSTPLSRFTNKFAIVNSLVALAGTIVIYVLTGNIERALAFWVALVPVIFAIIVPVATTIGISILAKRGIMVKNGEALEDLTRIDSIVFDKTGTLTKGEPEISKIILTGSQFDEKSFLALAASVEKYSEHPLGRPVIRKAQELNLQLSPVENVEVIKGKGMQGIYMGKKVLVGSPGFIEGMGIAIIDDDKKIVAERAGDGETPIFVAVDNALAGMIFMSDQLRPDIKQTMDALKQMHIKLTMLTGDNKLIAAKVADKIGLTRFYAEMLPQDKIKHIQEFKQQGEKVIMIGDGINDAPALSESNVGVAMGLRGVDVTLNAARVVLIKDDIQALPLALITSKKVLRIVRTNLYIATIIHVLAAIFSILGIVTILGSALIHQVSSAIVILNTLRLFEIDRQK